MGAITIKLKGHNEPVARENLFPEEFSGGMGPLLHQSLTYEALAAKKQIVVNTYNTGTGKTRAALLHLRDLGEVARQEHGAWQANCLLIAPTNELIRQHFNDAQAFVERNHLRHRVEKITAADLDDIDPGRISERRKGGLHGAKLREVLEASGSKLIVTNPDIFYAALYQLHVSTDQRRLLSDIISTFGYIIIDEFHYYNPKQLANFLFFMAFCKQLGRFEHGLQICLLSATPTAQVRTYLDRLGLDIAYISPEDATGEYETTPALSPVELTVYELASGGLLDLCNEKRSEVLRRVGDGEHGAGISGALWRVNSAFALFKGSLGDRIRRLTGVESREARGIAPDADFLLATPTVDIGFNFERKTKSRQSIDFLLFDARSGDQFVQRLGRAGRVLGKPETDTPSHVWAAAPAYIVEKLREFDGQEIDRVTLNRAMRDLERRTPLTTYIQTGAIVEAMRPITLYGKMVTGERDEWDDKLSRVYEGVRSVYAPGSKRTFASVKSYIYAYGQNEKDLKYPPAPGKPPKAGLVRRFMRERHNLEDSDFDEAEINNVGIKLAAPTASMGRQFSEWLEQKLEWFAAAKARFSFRDSFSPPQALIYDRGRLLSSEQLCRYDAIHVARNFDAKWFGSWEEWASHIEPRPDRPTDEDDPGIYCIIREMRAPEDRVELRLRVDGRRFSPADWEARYAFQEAAIKGIELVPVAGKLPEPLIDAFRRDYIPMFAAREGTTVVGWLITLCKSEGWVAHDLDVTNLESGASRQYKVVLGSAMLLALGELWMVCAKQRRIDAEEEPPLVC